MRRYIERHIEDAIAAAVIEHYEDKLIGIALSVRDGEIAVDTL